MARESSGNPVPDWLVKLWTLLDDYMTRVVMTIKAYPSMQSWGPRTLGPGVKVLGSLVERAL